MPRIDPVLLLNTLSVLLDKNGGIKGPNDVTRMVQLMQKFSKALVSKSVYVNILRNSQLDVLENFLNESGWSLLNTWFVTSIETANWAMCGELLKLYQMIPISAKLLKENAESVTATPRLVNQLRGQVLGNALIKSLACKVYTKWVDIVSMEKNMTVPSPTVELVPLKCPSSSGDDVVQKRRKRTTKCKSTFLSKETVIEEDSDDDDDDKSLDKSVNKKFKGKESASEQEVKNKPITKESRPVPDKNLIQKKSKAERKTKEVSSSLDNKVIVKNNKCKEVGDKAKCSSNSEALAKTITSKSNSVGELSDKRHKDETKKRETKSVTGHPASSQIKENGIKRKLSGENNNKHLPSFKNASKNEEFKFVELAKIPKHDSDAALKKTKSKLVESLGHRSEGRKIKLIEACSFAAALGSMDSMIKSNNKHSVNKNNPKHKSSVKGPLIEKPPPTTTTNSTSKSSNLSLVNTTEHLPSTDVVKPLVAKVPSYSDGLKEPLTVAETPPEPSKPEPDAPKLNFYRDTMEEEEVEEDVNLMGDDIGTKEPKRILVYHKIGSGKRRKSVTWPEGESLVDVRYFEYDKDERVNVNKPTYSEECLVVKEALKGSSLLHHGTMTTSTNTKWKLIRLKFETLQSERRFIPGSESTEKETQRIREAGVLQSLYFNRFSTTASPTEPDREDWEYIAPINIPLVDISGGPQDDLVRNFSVSGWPKPKALLPILTAPASAVPVSSPSATFDAHGNFLPSIEQNVSRFDGPAPFFDQDEQHQRLDDGIFRRDVDRLPQYTEPVGFNNKFCNIPPPQSSSLPPRPMYPIPQGAAPRCLLPNPSRSELISNNSTSRSPDMIVNGSRPRMEHYVQIQNQKYPNNFRERSCKFFNGGRGMCRFGRSCRFSHDVFIGPY